MKYITTDPQILDGTPIVKGTRVPVDVLLYRLEDGYSLDEIYTMYSWVDRETLKGAIEEAHSAGLGSLNSILHG
ncbi:DUF433 domain-containing protein [Kitasatospora sp. NPDC094028]